MKSLWKIAVPAGCVALICGVAITWHFVEGSAAERKLAEKAKERRVRAERGDAKAQSELAGMYYYGKGVPQDYGQALDWYAKPPIKGTTKLSIASATCVRRVSAFRKTTPRR